MKIRITMKDPDHSAYGVESNSAVFTHTLKGKAAKVFAKWFEYGEYVTVEIDTDTGTATVVPVAA